MFDIDKVDRNIEMFIFDIYIAILKIKKVVSEFNNPQDLQYDFIRWDSIIREFEIIGEASKYLLRDELLQKKYRKIVSFRNQITHEYFGIDPEIVWQIIHTKLDEIEDVIINLISEIKQPLKNELIDAFIEDNNYLDFIVEKLNQLKDRS
jgi:uncharacterized protein with HEPN domain